MKHIKSFQLFEKNLSQTKAELKYFQNEMDIDVNLNKLLDSIDAVELSANTIFPFLIGGEKIEELDEKEELQKELKERSLMISELFDTEELETLSKIRMKYYWIYSDDSSELDTPIYIMLQFFSPKKDEWSDIKLYYVQKDIENFYNEISTVTMEIKKKDDPNKKWIYTTSNSGQNWTLINPETATSSFKKVLNMEDVEVLASHSLIEVVFS